MERNFTFYVGEEHKVKVRFSLGDNCILLPTLIVQGKVVSRRNMRRILRVEHEDYTSGLEHSLSVRYRLVSREDADDACYCFREYGLCQSEFWQLYEILVEYCEKLGTLSCEGCPSRIMTVQGFHLPSMMDKENTVFKVWKRDKDAKSYCIVHIHKNGSFLERSEYYAIDLGMLSHDACILTQAESCDCIKNASRLLVLDNKVMHISDIGQLSFYHDPNDGTDGYGCSFEFICNTSKEVKDRLRTECSLTEGDFQELCDKLRNNLVGGCAWCE